MKAIPFSLEPPDHIRTRVEVVLGFLLTLALILLGVVWPSVFTLVALLVLPAPFLFIAAMIKRQIIVNQSIRLYLRTATYFSLVCWLYYAYFILTMTQPAR